MLKEPIIAQVILTKEVKGMGERPKRRITACIIGAIRLTCKSILEDDIPIADHIRVGTDAYAIVFAYLTVGMINKRGVMIYHSWTSKLITEVNIAFLIKLVSQYASEYLSIINKSGTFVLGLSWVASNQCSYSIVPMALSKTAVEIHIA